MTAITRSLMVLMSTLMTAYVIKWLGTGEHGSKGWLITCPDGAELHRPTLQSAVDHAKELSTGDHWVPMVDVLWYGRDGVLQGHVHGYRSS